MAKIVETVERDGHIINVYESGAEYDMTEKRLLKPANHTLITAENATVFNRTRKELARLALIDGANEAVQQLRPDLASVEEYGSQAYVRAIGYVTTQKALTAKDPKQTDAARMLLNIGERLDDDASNTPPASAVVGVAVEMASAFARVLADIVQAQAAIQQANVIDVSDKEG